MPDKALLESLSQDNKTRIAISEEELKGTDIPIADVKAKEKVSALRKSVTGIFYGVTFEGVTSTLASQVMGKLLMELKPQ